MLSYITSIWNFGAGRESRDEFNRNQSKAWPCVVLYNHTSYYTYTNYIHPHNQNLKYRIAIIMNERRIKNDL